MIRIFSAEMQQERKVITRAFDNKKAAIAWAKERVADESIAAISIWELRHTGDAKAALLVATEGKPWYEDRICVCVITRASVRVMR